MTRDSTPSETARTPGCCLLPASTPLSPSPLLYHSFSPSLSRGVHRCPRDDAIDVYGRASGTVRVRELVYSTCGINVFATVARLSRARVYVCALHSLALSVPPSLSLSRPLNGVYARLRCVPPESARRRFTGRDTGRSYALNVTNSDVDVRRGADPQSRGGPLDFPPTIAVAMFLLRLFDPDGSALSFLLYLVLSLLSGIDTAIATLLSGNCC